MGDSYSDLTTENRLKRQAERTKYALKQATVEQLQAELASRGPAKAAPIPTPAPETVAVLAALRAVQEALDAAAGTEDEKLWQAWRAAIKVLAAATGDWMRAVHPRPEGR